MKRITLALIALAATAGAATAAEAATTVNVNYLATPAGTPITIGASATPQYSFVLGTFFNGAAQYKIQANNGATVAFPDNGVSQMFLPAVTTRLEGITFTDGDYQLQFDIGSKPYTGLATVVDQGTRISAISYSALSAAVPEPATWAMMILGLFLIGGAMRRRKSTSVQVSYNGLIPVS